MPTGQTRPAGFIATPSFDLLFIILSPLLGLLLAGFLGLWRWPFEGTRFLGGNQVRVSFFIAIWTYAHLFAVVFRSHANPEIFHRHRMRFVAVPIVLFSGMMLSEWMLVAAFLLSAVWDVYHTSMQTFGFCRIYDAKLGNPPDVGRRLDMWMNHTIYIGPILGGLSLMVTVEGLNAFTDLGWDVPSRLYAFIDANRPSITTGVVAAGSLFSVYYVYAYWRLSEQGYRVAWQKVVLLVSTAVTSIYAWSFLAPIEAFFVANFFHALQYFAIVWWTERRSIRRTFGVAGLRHGNAFALVGYVLLLAGVGTLMEAGNFSPMRVGAAAVTTIALMHFWYDGFIWSVRSRDV